MASHVPTCQCRFCADMAKRVMTTEDWLKEHMAHGPVEIEPMDHPTGKLKQLTCPCGASHMTMKDE